MNKLETIKMSSTAIVSFSVTTGSALLMLLVEKSEHIEENAKILLAFVASFVYLGLYLTSLSGTVAFFDKFIIKNGNPENE